MEEPPISVREGGLIKDGYNENVDKYRHAKTEGKSFGQTGRDQYNADAEESVSGGLSNREKYGQTYRKAHRTVTTQHTCNASEGHKDKNISSAQCGAPAGKQHPQPAETENCGCGI